MPEYLYILHPYRHGFFEAPTPEEEAAMGEHFQYLRQAAEAGSLLLAGPCPDDTFGLVIIRVESDEAANTFMFNDPSIRADVMMAELHPFHASILGKAFSEGG